LQNADKIIQRAVDLFDDIETACSNLGTLQQERNIYLESYLGTTYFNKRAAEKLQEELEPFVDALRKHKTARER
jgi:hypothetical protein